MTHTLLHGDCLERLKELPNNSVDAVVTDPPYGLSFMGKKWDYDVPSEDIWRECLRVLKPGGHLLAFAGTRTQHRMAVRIEDAGFEIRDMIAWVYGSGFPKSHNLNGEWQGWGTALKPALEPITVARKPFKDTVAANVLAHGTGALNIDGCRVGTEVETWPSSRSYGSDGTEPSFTNGSKGKKETQKTGKAPPGRWPANLIHDGSEEVVGLFPQSKAPKPYEKSKAGWLTPGSTHEVNDLQSVEYGDSGSAARFFYCSKASKKDRNEGLDKFELKAGGLLDQRPSGDFHTRLGDGPTQPRKNNHPTVKPTALMRYLCRLVTPPGGTVLDPFMGSGSTGKAAMLEGFQFIGIEREAEYLEIAKARIEHAENQQSETLL